MFPKTRSDGKNEWPVIGNTSSIDNICCGAWFNNHIDTAVKKIKFLFFPRYSSAVNGVVVISSMTVGF